ncbi:MAG: hypothetical protein U0R50_08645 [Gaiellales bacterium]
MLRRRFLPLLIAVGVGVCALAVAGVVVTRFGWREDPIALAVAVAVAVFVAQLAGLVTRRALLRERGERRLRVPSGGLLAVGRAVTSGALVGLALFGAVTALAWTRAPTRVERIPAGFSHTGAVTYLAAARGGIVYADSEARTGEPVFRSLADTVHVEFAYALETRNRAELRGSTALDVRISDPESGWQRTLPLAPPAPFAGTAATATGALDLRSLGYLLRSYRDATGMRAERVDVTVLPRVEVTGYAGDVVLDETFAPAFAFTFDHKALRPVGELSARNVGRVLASVPVRLAVDRYSVTVERTRRLALLGLATSAGALALGLLFLLAGLLARLRGRRDGRIVEARAASPEGRWVSELASLDELLRVAETYDRVVVHLQEEGRDVYLVDDGVALYRYVAASLQALDETAVLAAAR